ncbi:MAG: hypothetical protein KAW84_00565 [Thermoplasmata archaeon]|nr:hypothetical protein [Thermoplasmata archaeon]
MARQRFWAMCLECGHGWTPDRSKGQLRCNKCGSRNVLKAAPDEVLDHVRRKAWKERAQKLSLGPKAAAEKRRAQGRAGKGPHDRPRGKPSHREKSEDTERPIHKRIGVKADKLERIVADFERAERRSELDEDGRPLISEEHNVEWIHLIGKVEWRTAHRIFHEVLMKGVECTLPIGYKSAE